MKRLTKEQARTRYNLEVEWAKQDLENTPACLAERIAGIRERAEEEINSVQSLYANPKENYKRAINEAKRRLRSRKPYPNMDGLFLKYYAEAVEKHLNQDGPLWEKIQKSRRVK